MTRLVCFMASVALLAATTTTVQADIVWTSGAPGGTSGGALFFDGSEGGGLNSDNGIEFLQTGISNEIQGGDYTVSYWINASNVAAEQYAVGTTRQSLHLGLNGGDAFQGHWGGDSSGSSTDIVSNTWFHQTFTYDSVTDTQLIYVNGVLATAITDLNVGNGEIAGPNPGPNRAGEEIILGARSGNTAGLGGARDHLTDTSLDDVAFFNTVLSAADIADLAAGTTDALALGANAYYDFEDDQLGTTAAVQSAAGVTAFGNTLTAITVTAVPEPSSLAIMLGLGIAGLTRRKRS